MTAQGFHHIPILLEEVLQGLKVKPDGVYVDGTAGGGGHSLRIAERLDPAKGGFLLALDQDGEAVEAASARLAPYADRSAVMRSSFSEMKAAMEERGFEKADGILLDLGVSSHQLDTADRGFSYLSDAPLDMRMDRRNSLTAADIVNQYSEMELYRIIRDYGEDRFAKNIAKHIVAARQEGPILTTSALVEIICQSIPMKVRKTGGHPAKRTFQALRIEVNSELSVLQETLDRMTDLLNPGGRLAVITFHSLEDRIVKTTFRRNENPCICPPGLPVCVCGRKSTGHQVNRRPILPSEEEIARNPRAKSAKLRIWEENL